MFARRLLIGALHAPFSAPIYSPLCSHQLLYSSQVFSSRNNWFNQNLQANIPGLYNGVGFASKRTTIFTALPSSVIWEGVTGPKGASKKRARGKRRVAKQSVDLNKGQKLGKGKVGVSLPGLNESIPQSTFSTRLKISNVDEEYFKKLNEYRSKAFKKRKRIKLPPLLRGWRGASLEGQALPLPHPLNINFESRVLELKAISHMVATRGRFRRFSAIVGSGNGSGVCGLGIAKAQTMRGALTRAKERSFRNLITVNLKEGRTLWHDGYVQEWHSTIFAKPADAGYGLVCHRLLKTLAKVIGIQDMHAKVEGSTKNYRCIARAFLRMLSEQASYKELSDRLGLHVVEFTQERDFVPRVLASPSGGEQFTRKRIDEPNVGSSVDETNFELTLKRNQAQTTHQMTVVTPDRDGKDRRAKELSKLPHMRPGATERPVLEVSNPRRKPELPCQKAGHHTSFIDDLTFETSGYFLSKENEIQDVETLLHAGERDLNSLITYAGRVPRVSKNAMPGYLRIDGVRKMEAMRHRYRNHADVKRKRAAFTYLDAEM